MIDPVSLAAAAIIGMVIGMIVGLLPGLGIGTATLLMLPVLSQIEPMSALFFFVAMLVVSQYFGSITALIYGVPGELSSYPMINERANLLGQVNQVLYQTAMGSLVGGLSAAVLLVCLIFLGNIWISFYHYHVMTVVMALAFAAVVLFGSPTNSKIHNAVLFAAGYFVSKIGFDANSGQSWGTFGLSELTTGIPLIPLAFGLIVIPAMSNSWKQGAMAQISYNVKVKMQHWASVIRGTLLGIVGGMVPGMTYLASTQLAYMTERWRHPQNGSHQRVISTSTADNAGATSSLYTLLWLGIPISIGEAVIVYLFDRQNQVLTWSTLQTQISWQYLDVSIFGLLMLVFVVANLLAFVLSWPARRLSVWLVSRLLNTRTLIFVLSLMILSLVFAALDSYSIPIFVITLIMATIIGLIFRKKDWIPLIIGYILETNITMVLLKLNILSY